MKGSRHLDSWSTAILQLLRLGQLPLSGQQLVLRCNLLGDPAASSFFLSWRQPVERDAG